MGAVDQAIAWFRARESGFSPALTHWALNEGMDNGGRAVQLDLDTDQVTASAFIWDCAWVHLEALAVETAEQLIDDFLREPAQPLHQILDHFLEQVSSFSHQAP